MNKELKVMKVKNSWSELNKRQKPLTFIAGLCVIEDEETTIQVAQKLKQITSKYPNVDFIFKASFDKANRTSIRSFRGLGFEKGMNILRKVKKQTNVKILTDVHTKKQASNITAYYDVIDVIQIPAFLCRQTDLVTAIAKARKIVNIKKGQFLAPEDVINIVEKIEIAGNNKIMITERGTCFGYHNLIVDFRSFLIMKKFGYPVIFDATHSQQRPSGRGNESGGSREYTIPMIKAAVTVGVDGIFIEVHPNPPEAKSDSATSLYLKDVDKILQEIIKIRRAI